MFQHPRSNEVHSRKESYVAKTKCLLPKEPTVQEVIDVRVAMSHRDDFDELSRTCADGLSELFHCIKHKQLSHREPTEVVNMLAVEKIIAATIDELVRTCSEFVADDSMKERTLDLIDSFIAECKDQMLLGHFVNKRSNIWVIGAHGGALSRFVNGKPDDFKDAAFKGLDPIGKYMSMYNIR